jgi:acetyltransferase-like isoleucine patch superfamily enzyme
VSASAAKPPRSHGDGRYERSQLGACGQEVVIEDGVLIFHPEHVFLGDRVYVGHQTMLKAYYQNELRIGEGTWIGQQCFFHSAGGIVIGQNVGVGPGVKILTSVHAETPRAIPILHAPLAFAPVHIEDDADLGVGAIVLPGIRIGRGAQVGAGAVVTRDVPPYAVVAGNPARVLRERAP